MKQWRPKFSLRTLAVVVTLVCVYFGCWEATNTWGIPAVPERQEQLWSPCPFLIVKAEYEDQVVWSALTVSVEKSKRRYWLWFPGWAVVVNPSVDYIGLHSWDTFAVKPETDD